MSTRNVFKVMDELYKEPNVWHDIQVIAYRTDLTSKQVSSIAQTAYCSCICRSKGPTDRLLVMVKGDDATLRESRKRMVKKLLKVSDDDIDRVYSYLSPAGWMTASDLVDETGLPRTVITRILPALGNIESRTVDKAIMYRRLPDMVVEEAE